MTFKINDCFAIWHKTMMLKCAHCIKLIVFIALNKDIGRSMQTNFNLKKLLKTSILSNLHNI